MTRRGSAGEWQGLWALILLGLAAAACAAPTDLPEDPSANSIATLEEFCHARAEAECSPAVVNACQSGSTEACVAARESVCRSAAPQGARYVAKNAPACVSLVKDVFATATLTAEEVRAISKACDAAVFAGPGEVRAPCTASIDCDSALGLDCMLPLGAPAGSTGKCLVPKLVSSGSPCDGEAERCQDGMFCDEVTRVCVPAAPVGQPCQQSEPASCQPGSQCMGSGIMGPPSCVALAQAGSACTSDADCANGLCDRPAASGNGTCTPSVQLVSIGASCQGFRP
jgi:hypothetical protein